MKKINLLIILFFVFSISVNAQQQKTNAENIGVENQINTTSKTKVLEKSKRETKGDKYFFKYSFHKAIGKYVRVKELSINGQRNLAESYTNIGENEKAENVYSEMISSQSGVSSEDYYNYASLLKNSGKYNDAFKMMDKFSEMKPEDLRAKDYIANKDKFADLSKDDGSFKVQKMEISSNADDFAPNFYKDKIVFASTKKASKMIVRNYNWTGKPFWNLYVADIENGQLKKSKYFIKSRNSKYHDGPASFSNNDTFMAFTRNKINDDSKDNVVEMLIFFSSFVDNKWTEAVPFALNNKEYMMAHPFLTPDGNTMYFASDMPGGFGGSDIYRVTRLENGSWSAAENLGNTINTEGDEMFPFLESTNQILFFTSNGLFGLGGLDIFYCSINGSEFGNVKNAGYPLNTQYDDFAVIVDNMLNIGYFSSNRIGGSGGDDIYGFDLLKNLKIDKRIEGIAKDNNGKTLSETLVILLDIHGELIDSITTKDNGAYDFIALADNNYILIGKNENYQDGKTITNTYGKEPIIKADLTLLKEEAIVKTIKEEIVVVIKEEVISIIEKENVKIEGLNPIYFDFDKSNIRPDAEIELKKIVVIMNNNPIMVVELRSYTDSRGTEYYNKNLSNQRAKATLDYIKAGIVNPERIYGKGYGESSLTNKCDKDGKVVSPCTEKQHQNNRRTEFFIQE